MSQQQKKITVKIKNMTKDCRKEDMLTRNSLKHTGEMHDKSYDREGGKNECHNQKRAKTHQLRKYDPN